jgi:hypothetical protein
MEVLVGGIGPHSGVIMALTRVCSSQETFSWLDLSLRRAVMPPLSPDVPWRCAKASGTRSTCVFFAQGGGRQSSLTRPQQLLGIVLRILARAAAANNRLS